MLQTKSLNENRDFKRIYRIGKSFVHPVLVTYIVKNKLGYNRMGITATKKIGKAVQRNRARRLIREAYRVLEPDLTLPAGVDIVFVARTKTTLVKMNDVLKPMQSHFDKYKKAVT